MVMHARKHLRLDGYFDRNQTHSYENSGGKYSKSPFGDSCNDKSPAAENAASMAAAMDSPENSRRPSPRYLHKASYTQRLKERDHHHEVKSPMSKERNRSRDHSHHHSSSSSAQHHGQQSNSTPGSSRKQSSSSTSETSTSNYARSNHDRSHAVEVKMEPEKERKGQVGDWSEHVSSSGKKYYYNCRTEVSQWEKPREWVEYEKVHGINKSAEIPNKSKEKNSSITPNKSSERHSNSNSRSNTASRTSQHHQQHASSSHPQRGSHSHTHRHDRSHQSASNRSHGNDQRNVDQASSASSSSSNSSNSSNSSASAIRASAGTARNSGRRDDNKPVSRSGETPVEVSSDKQSESRLNDHGASSRQESGSNHHSNYHTHHHNSGGNSSNKRSIVRKDLSQDMDISPDSSFITENNNFSSTGRETPRSHLYHQQHLSSHPQQQQLHQTPLSGATSTPGRMSKSGNGNFYVSSQSAMTTPNQSLVSINSTANPQLLSPSQVTLANLPRLISQLTGTRGLPNLSEMSQQEALQTVQQALQLTKQLGGLSRSPHGASSNLDSKNALALSPALLSATAALRDGQTGNQINFYPLGSEGGRMDSSARGTAGCLSPSSDFHSHSSRQTSPASSGGSPTSVSVTVNSNSSNVTTSVAAAMAAAAAAANSGGSLASAVSLKPSTPSLTPSLANYYREDLVTHITGWQADHAERQASRYSEEAHNIGSLNCTRVSAELKMARSLVRLAEIQATLQEQRILFLRQQVKELEAKTNCRQNSFMMDS